MPNPVFILLPLYIWPTPGAWEPLFTAAKSHPNVDFRAIINPWDGPGEGNCPDPAIVNATATLNTIPNIKTLGYVHTANRYDCGPYGTWICPCSQPLSALESNITKYQNWPTAGCSEDNELDIHIDGIFLDEAPADGNCSDYMNDAASFVRRTMTHGGNTVLFNAGAQVDDVYWGLADYINVLEDTEAAYYRADIGALDGQGVYHEQSTMIIHSYTDGEEVLRRDVDTILNRRHDAMAGVFISDLNVYNRFPENWEAFVDAVETVMEANMDLD